MILNPKVLALVLVSVLTAGMASYASAWGVQILRFWDVRSGSELQLALERRTYLISTLLSHALGFELLSLFLFIYTADSLCPQFAGAMCAVGTLNVNGYGYPTLALKMLAFLLAGLWLVVNAADNSAPDYPLTRAKYGLLLAITPLFAAEAVLQWVYFRGLVPDVITSCCGSLFGLGGRTVASEIAAFPPGPTMLALGAAGLAVSATGAAFLRWGRGGALHGAASAVALVVSLAAVVSLISPYLYELPTHHCPFCLLQKEYGYVGYPLYVLLLLGGVTGMGTGILEPFRATESLRASLPAFRRRLCVASLVCFGLFAALVAWRIAVSNLQLGG